jgi:hypothetical protein
VRPTEFLGDDMDIKLGDVFRMGEWPFADAVVTKIEDNDRYTLSRPYMYASEYGHPLVGFEPITHLSKSLLVGYKKIDSGRVS